MTRILNAETKIKKYDNWLLLVIRKSLDYADFKVATEKRRICSKGM